MTNLKFSRVFYGKNKTPLEDREFRLNAPGAPVGTIEETKAHFKRLANITGEVFSLEFKDLDGKIYKEVVR